MKVTTREHLLFCTTCLFSFYYRRRSLSSGMHKVGGGVSGVRRLPKCDTFMDRISFICETSFLLCVCCSSSHHSPLLLLCFFSLRVACFYCFARFFFFWTRPLKSLDAHVAESTTSARARRPSQWGLLCLAPVGKQEATSVDEDDLRTASGQ